MAELQPHIAAIDLGSNSFHLAIAREDGAALSVVYQQSTRVQLALNMRRDQITPHSLQTALDCLVGFQQIINEHQATLVAVVGTAALRKAANTQHVLIEITKLLGVEVDILTGLREAELIHLAVSANQQTMDGRMIIDIGGGSTELAVRQQDILMRQSLPFGCVTVLQQFMPDNLVAITNMKAAVEYCQVGIEEHGDLIAAITESEAIGCSGTIQAIGQVLVKLGLTDGSITLAGVTAACDALLTDFQQIDDIQIAGLPADRQKLFTSGIALVIALLEALPIQSIKVVSVALREGLLVEFVQQNTNNTVSISLDR